MFRGARILASAGLAWLMATAGVTQASAQEVKIGVVVGQTGTFAFVGDPLVKGIRMAWEELEAKKYFGNLKVSILFEDNRSDTPEALALINRMAVRDNATMIIGPISSGEGMAAGPVAVNLKIPMFTTATSPDVLKAGPWVFKYTEDAEIYMANLAKKILELKPKACFVVTIRDNEGYIRQKNIFRDLIAAGGIKIAADESILAADTDFTALSTKITGSGADCLFLSTTPDGGANIITQARQAGMPASMLLVGNTGMSSPNYVKIGGKAVVGTYYPAEWNPAGVNDFAKAFIANYTKKYNVAPEAYSAAGYSMMLIAASAIKNAGPAPTRDSIREAMAKTKDVQVVLGQGTFSIDAERRASFGTAVLQTQEPK